MRRWKLYLGLILILILALGGLAFSFPAKYNELIEKGEKRFKFSASNLKLPEIPFKLGLDLQGGVHLVYQADLSEIEKTDWPNAMAGLRDVIERRVNLFGVQEPIIQVIETREGFRLAVEIAGAIDPTKAIEIIGKTPFLEFRRERSPEESAKILAKKREVEKAQKEGKKIEEIENWQLAFEDPFFKPTQLTGRYLKKAQLGFDPTTQEPLVLIDFDSEGAKIFEKLTEENIGKRLAIYIDDQLISAPTVQEKIKGGSAQITGQFTIEEAKELARNLSAGALPVPINLIYQEQVGPILGKISLEKSLRAGIFGFFAIILFIIIFYRLAGILAAITLILYVIFALSIFKLAGITLTLAGIGGFILSIGMAIDANILILSRLREEIKEKENISWAIKPAFSRAWPAIRDGNLTTLMVALILFSLGTGFIKGFAFTLGLGLLVSIACAMIISKILMIIFLQTRLAKIKWLF
jgi:protein-export membrane protein SecD